MLTEVDIERIMAAKKQLAESVVEEADRDLIDDTELFEVQEEDLPISETTGRV
jgi:hypothetical protein